MTFEKNIFDLSNTQGLFILEGKERVSQQEFLSKIQLRKIQLSQFNIGPGHKVVMTLPNSKEFCEYFFALWEIGACVVPLSHLSTEKELAGIVSQVRPTLVVKSNGSIEALTNFTLIDEESILILHTSGSSGKPKGVVLGRKALMNKMATYNSNLPVGDLTNTLCMLPLNFGHGLISNFLFPLLSGHQVFLAPNSRMDVYSSLGEIIDEFNISAFSSVPSILKIAANFSNPPRKKSLKRIFCASAPLDKITWENTLNWSSGIKVNNMYGMTELGSWIGGDLNPGDFFEENTFDSPWGADIKIIKENDSDDFGEIFLHSDSMMSGYFEDQANTNKVLSDGWFKTGDLGLYINGKIKLKGRVDNVINLSGTKVYPEEINQVVRQHPGIADAFSFGLKLNENEGDHAIACVIVSDGKKDISTESIQELCKEQLSSYKIPSQFKVIEKLPVNERGKIDKQAIKSLFQRPKVI